MKRKEIRKGFVYWFPRIGGLVFALFLLIFSFDVFESSTGFWQGISMFLLHSMPSFILLIIVRISWKGYELVGGIGFILMALFILVIMALSSREMIFSNPIVYISLIIGIFFLIGWKRNKNQNYSFY